MVLRHVLAGTVPMKRMEGLAASSTAMVKRLRCSPERPYMPGSPTIWPWMVSSSTTDSVCSTRSAFCMFINQSEIPAVPNGPRAVIRCSEQAGSYHAQQYHTRSTLGVSVWQQAFPQTGK